MLIFRFFRWLRGRGLLFWMGIRREGQGQAPFHSAPPQVSVSVSPLTDEGQESVFQNEIAPLVSLGKGSSGLQEEESLQETLSAPWLKGEIIREVQRFVSTQRSVHTRRAYEGDLKQFISFLRSGGLAGDSFESLIAFRDWLVKEKHQGGLGISRVSANRKFATVRAFLTWLQSRGKVRDNPAPWVRNFRAQTESPTQAFTDAEVAHILDLPNRATSSGLMHSVMLHLL